MYERTYKHVSLPLPAVMFPQPRYYRALNDYHPQYMSENAGREDEELGFMENDIIQARENPYNTCVYAIVISLLGGSISI